MLRLIASFVHPFTVALSLIPVSYLTIWLAVFLHSILSWLPFVGLLSVLYLFAWREDARRDPRVWYPFRREVKRRMPSN